MRPARTCRNAASSSGPGNPRHGGEELPLVTRGADHHRNPVRRTGRDRIQGKLRQLLAIDAGLEHHGTTELRAHTGPRLHQACRIERQEFGRRHIRRHPGQFEQSFRDFRRPRHRLRGTACAALRNCAVEEPGGRSKRHQCADAHAPRRLAEDGHTTRIAAESLDVVAHPLERLYLVEQSLVARRRHAAAGDFAQVDEAERPEPVVDRHHHCVAAPRKGGAVVDRRAAGAAGEAAAVDPHQHGPLAIVEAGGPHVEIEAVLVTLGAVRVERELERPHPFQHRLPRLGTEVHRTPHATPGCRVGGRPPAQLADWGCRERHAKESVQPVGSSALDPTVLCLDDGHGHLLNSCRATLRGAR